MEPAVPGPSRIDKGKGVATHSRHGSIDEHPRASSSSFLSSSTASAAKSDREGEQPNPSLEEEEEERTGHIRERPKKAHRRISSKRLGSPGRSPNPVEYIGQGPEDPARGPPGPPHGYPFNGRPPMPNGPPRNDGPRFPQIQTLPGNFSNGFGSSEVSFGVPDPPPLFIPSPMQASFPPPMPLPMPPPNYQLNGLPLSGYELLAAKLSGGIAGPRIAPIYRRFELLHHRLLLHMQDELIEMEEQLHNLDAADTQRRKFPGGVFPASRRKENMSPTGTTWQRKDIISHIAQKLYQYNQVITSFSATYHMAEANIEDVVNYRSYLNAINPLVEEECQFLEASDDLVDLGRRRRRSNGNPQDDTLIPVPRSSSLLGFPPPPSSQISNVGSSIYQKATGISSLKRLVLAMAMIVLAPIICFSVIPGFVGRMTVVFLVGLGGTVALLQSGLFSPLTENRSTLDWVLCAGVYGGVMAVIAGII